VGARYTHLGNQGRAHEQTNRFGPGYTGPLDLEDPGVRANPRLALDRLGVVLFGSFAGSGLLLAAVGIYGVMAFTVLQRTQEFGLRMALGAQPRDVLNLVIRQGVKLVIVGLVIGTGGALALTRLMRPLLFNVGAVNPLMLAGVAALFCAVALLACWIPARRATKVDPMAALRSE